ncbi:hypothetical protein N8T08_004113 [Aspergillus melleus]|uniref:Uncharacterized protein n=1 Tax=Aspergillus melleus TaxID=138277 RepID=A0ACC3B5L0_9EURO|nr:hypothetical protein N8T08_004113 [Aspergillus melleus]
MDISETFTQLSPTPTAFPNCCLSISTTLLSHLASLLPQTPSFTISIGSGSGLLEALLSLQHPDVSIEGVEVNSTVNRYIPEQHMNIVHGTWDLHPRVKDAAAWMFVYPREPNLVSRYLNEFVGGQAKVIVWLGPRADWADYEPCFRGSAVFADVQVQEDVGLAEFETQSLIKAPDLSSAPRCMKHRRNYQTRKPGLHIVWPNWDRIEAALANMPPVEVRVFAFDVNAEMTDFGLGDRPGDPDDPKCFISCGERPNLTRLLGKELGEIALQDSRVDAGG